MVSGSKSTDLSSREGPVIVDVIVLGCSLPGIVAAHKLKKKFGNTMEIVVLDLVKNPKSVSKSNVAFQEEIEQTDEYFYEGTATAKDLNDNIARLYLNIYANEYKIPLPDAIMNPEKLYSHLQKIFEHEKGTIVKYAQNLHSYDYLNVLEKFELNQYQMVLEQSMKDLFQANKVCDDSEREKLLYYDQTSIEKHICFSLLFPTSREIMRNIVKLVCGVSPNDVSVLFYLHQCYRSSSTKNHLDGNNTRLREKLLGYFRKHLANKLLKSIASIRLSTKSIKEIRSYTGEKLILKTLKGDTSYICNLLAMALKPDELCNIEFESKLLSESETAILSSMKKGTEKKFSIQYEENFWRKDGNSGDIFSLRGPIIWATERPKLASTGSAECFATLIGYLKNNDDDEEYSKQAVINQLTHLFGEEAANPVSYKESNVNDIYVPLRGNFIALRRLLERSRQRNLQWGALDIFADGDIAAALEAGHNAYLHLLAFLRPQAQSYEDLRAVVWPTLFNSDSPFRRWIASLNFALSVRLVAYSTAVYLGFRIMQHLRN